jgi:hypothetical protein
MRCGCLTRCAQTPSCGLGGLTLSALSHKRWCPRHCEVFLEPIDPQLEPGVPAADQGALVWGNAGISSQIGPLGRAEDAPVPVAHQCDRVSDAPE